MFKTSQELKPVFDNSLDNTQYQDLEVKKYFETWKHSTWFYLPGEYRAQNQMNQCRWHISDHYFTTCTSVWDVYKSSVFNMNTYLKILVSYKLCYVVTTFNPFPIFSEYTFVLPYPIPQLKSNTWIITKKSWYHPNCTGY